MFPIYLLKHLWHYISVFYYYLLQNLVCEFRLCKKLLVWFGGDRREEELLDYFRVVESFVYAWLLCRYDDFLIVLDQLCQRDDDWVHLLLLLLLSIFPIIDPIQTKPYLWHNQPLQHITLCYLHIAINHLRLWPQLNIHQQLFIYQVEYLLSIKYKLLLGLL